MPPIPDMAPGTSVASLAPTAATAPAGGAAATDEISERLAVALAELQAVLMMLQQRLQNLARREEELAGTQAQIDQQTRKQLLQRQEMEEQQTRLDEQSGQLAAHQQELAARGEQLDLRQAALEAREGKLEQRAADLDRRAAELEARHAELATRESELAEGWAELESRGEKLQEAQAMLEQRHQALARFQQVFSEVVATLEIQTAGVFTYDPSPLGRTLPQGKEPLQETTGSVVASAPSGGCDSAAIEVSGEDAGAASGEEPPPPAGESPRPGKLPAVPPESDPPHVQDTRDADAPLPDSDTDESKLDPEELQRMRVLRRLTGGKFTDAQLLERIRQERAAAGEPASGRKSWRRWWS